MEGDGRRVKNTTISHTYQIHRKMYLNRSTISEECDHKHHHMRFFYIFEEDIKHIFVGQDDLIVKMVHLTNYIDSVYLDFKTKR